MNHRHPYRSWLRATLLGVGSLLIAPSASAINTICDTPDCPTGCGEATPGGGGIQDRLALINRSLYGQPQAKFRPEPSETSPMQQRYLARISHTYPTAAADLRTVARRAPSSPFDVEATTPARSSSPRAAPQHVLGALATDRYERSGLGTAGPLPAGSSGQLLYGDMPGQWDEVRAYVTFPYSFDRGVTTDQLLLRGLFATATGSGDTYQASGWSRSAYWLTGADGIPRLLASAIIVPNYVPAPGDPFTDSGTLSIAPLMLYKEDGRDYSAYPADGAYATIFFVADPFSGEILDAVVDLYDANSVYEKTEYLYEGDSMQPLLLLYRLEEPDFTFYAEYGGHILLGENVTLELEHHVPGVDYVDPFLSAIGFDAANTPLDLLFEGVRELPGGELEWGYSPPYPLGYTWGQAADELFAADFEAATQGAPKAQIVRKRRAP